MGGETRKQRRNKTRGNKKKVHNSGAIHVSLKLKKKISGQIILMITLMTVNLILQSILMLG